MNVQDLDSLAKVWIAELSAFVHHKAMAQKGVAFNPRAADCSKRMTGLVVQLANIPPHHVMMLGMKIQEYAGPGSFQEEALMDILAKLDNCLQAKAD